MDDPLLTIRGLFRRSKSDQGYTEYGYRGLEEIRLKEKQIEELKKRIEDLEKRIQPQHNRIGI